MSRLRALMGHLDQMPLRRRLTLAAAAAVAVSVLIAVIVSYVAVAHELRARVDDQLRALVEPGRARVLRLPLATPGEQIVPFPQQPGPRQGGPGVYFTVRLPDGSQRVPPDQPLRLPFDSEDQDIQPGEALLRDKRVDGVHLRTITFAGPGGVRFQAARPLGEIDSVLKRLRLVLIAVCVGGVALAAWLGRLVGRGLMAPIAEVAAAADHIGRTDDLGRRIAVRSGDEVGQLAGRFNAMLDSLQASRAQLDQSVQSQRQLVADASHELRTPVTSLRTNVEVLLAGAELHPEDRERLLADVREQTEELSALVADLIELARGDEPARALEDVRLDELAEEAVARARRHTPRVSFALSSEPVVLDGVADRLARALNNLLDNAARHSPDGATVDVQVSATGVVVRDRGQGIAAEDLPHVFDRFYRGAAARGQSGTGLGLAIVRQVAVTHGGDVRAENAPDGGACFEMRLPGRVVAAA